jgi:hypothetical protein
MTSIRSIPIRLAAAVMITVALAGCDHSWRYRYFVNNHSYHPVTVEYLPVDFEMGHPLPPTRKWERAIIPPRTEQMFHEAHQFLGSPIDRHPFTLRILQDTTVIYSQDMLTRRMWDIWHSAATIWGGFQSHYTLNVFDVDDTRRAGYVQRMKDER